MLKRLVQWLKRLFRGLFGSKSSQTPRQQNVEKTAPPPLSDTDLEFLFTQLLDGVHQARGQAWAQNWLKKIENRVSTERWIEWLKKFEERLLASGKPHNELAARFVQLGELRVGEVGDTAYKIGMNLLTQVQGEPIWEYDGPDAVSPAMSANSPEEEYQTVTWDELLVMLQENEQLRDQIVQDFAIEADDPQKIVEALIQQAQTMNQSPPEN
jgi:hypothetical protein